METEKERKMQLIADMHMHTVASTHAYSTVGEMVHAAALGGLYCVAITDHGARMPGAPGKWYFENLRVIPRMLEGVLVLRGQETDLLDCDGGTDLGERDAELLDWVVASIHRPAFGGATDAASITEAWLAVAGNPKVNVIGHSGTAGYEYDYDKVIPEFGRGGKLVELNEGTFTARPDSLPNCVKIMRLCKKHRVPVIVNSDAHFHTSVGRCENCLKLLREIDFPEELVVNADVGRFREYLRRHTRVFEDPAAAPAL